MGQWEQTFRVLRDKGIRDCKFADMILEALPEIGAILDLLLSDNGDGDLGKIIENHNIKFR